ncbi:integrase family protein [Ottowia beijingensis]|uniref:Integrase family protein n=1 Tax=Ottowia beijingensis TaxID=1207057 RepID=A0A853IKI8_9BURK|nr:integrase family protein [Ottowia beijingensis]NZA01193.1 integrase family protein [Ottowia beijingensis]
MARPRKTEAPDLAHAVDLTAGAIERLSCPTGKQQAFLRDSKAPGLRVRVTAAGAKAYVFEAKLNRQTIRRTIGDVRAWTIEQARAEANRLRVTLDAGQDPRELERERQAKAQAAKAAQAAQAVTVGETWAAYMQARRAHWGARHHADHAKLIRPGGEKAKRGTRGRGVTIAGPLHPLMALRLGELDADTMRAWAKREAETRPTSARLALRCLKAFLAWCGEQKAYAGLVNTDAASGRDVREVLGRAKPKTDALLSEQLSAWFSAVRAIGNPVIAAALQVMLLTGARPGEVLAMKWADLNHQWRGITMRDKVEGDRVIPLTPYVAQLLAGLPHRNAWVFSSPGAADGVLSWPAKPHAQACAVAGIEGLTLHGLRRSFGSLSEWLELPAGVVAQIQGHKPSATAEKHYRVRPLDLLRVHHERIEAWMLEQAKIEFDAKAKPGKLRAVK